MAGHLPPRCAVVALGSNLGDSKATLRRALAELGKWAEGRLEASSLWKSAPLDCPPGSPDFLNAVCLWNVGPETTPESLLEQLQAMECAFGRTEKKVLNEARPLDLDLIAFGQNLRAGPRLILPHPRAHLRRFVLAPLHEIAPDLLLPGWGGTVAKVLSALGPDPGDTVREPS